jgi:hypothetical protein
MTTNGPPLEWTTYAGGVFAADDRYSYTADTGAGKYMINPVSHKDDCSKHIGYRVWFVDVRGKTALGLYQPLAKHLVNLPKARRLCRGHYQGRTTLVVNSSSP